MFRNIVTSFLLATVATAGPLPLENREYCPVITTVKGILVGDGSPHQNFVYKQVSGTTDCTNNPSGSASITKTQTVTWTVNGGFSGGFFSAGFAVQESVATGSTNAFGCKTNKGTITGNLCVFERLQTTAYTVDEHRCVSSCSTTSCINKGPYVMTAPNAQQPGCFYDNKQLNLPCNGLGSTHVVASGPAGGPHAINCQAFLP